MPARFFDVRANWKGVIEIADFINKNTAVIVRVEKHKTFYCTYVNNAKEIFYKPKQAFSHLHTILIYESSKKKE